jgi:hypothetical protein
MTLIHLTPITEEEVKRIQHSFACGQEEAFQYALSIRQSSKERSAEIAEQKTSASEKTIAELSGEYGVHRTTLNKAVERGAFPFRRSGNIILIDEESEQFRAWLAGNGKGRPRKSFLHTASE